MKTYPILVTVLLILSATAQAATSAADRPNILFIFSDDQSWEALGMLGSQVETPNLDRLAERGVYFSHSYNMGAWHGAVCVASRTMLNSGRSIWRALDLESRSFDDGQAKLWAEYLQEAGYDTYMSGKWHVAKDVRKVFETVEHPRPGMPRDARPNGYFRPNPENPDPWTPWDPQWRGYWEGGTHWSEVLGNDAVAFIEQAAGKEKPFFMYLAFNAPHDPRQSPKSYVDRYPREDIIVPENFLPEYPYKQEIGCYRTNSSGKPDYLRDEKLAPWPRTKEAIQLHRQEYYAIITHMDDQVGRILEALESSGKAEETVIVFTSDHGLAIGHHGLLGKQNMYEHSLRVPMILAGPDFPAGKRIDTPVYLQDVMPTTLELAGRSIPDCVEFKSLLPLIRDEATHQYDALYGCMWKDKQRAAIKGDYKIMYYPKAERYRLFNLAEDPLEVNDLAEDASHRAILANMQDVLHQLQVQMDDPMLD